jgi:hypothetical protein
MSNDCLEILDEWIKTQKEVIYDENIKGPNNKSDVISNYTASLKNISLQLRQAIRSRNVQVLTSFGWPSQLVECINDANMRLEIEDRVIEWFETFPNVKSSKHLNILNEESRL